MFAVPRAVRVACWLGAAALLLVAVPTASAAVSIVTTPNPGTSNTLNGLVAFAPNDIWGVGTASSPSYSGCHGRTLRIHSGGGAFSEVSEASPTPICAAVNAVAATSASDIWAVGSANSQRDPHVRHFDGATWTASAGATIPVPPSGGRRLHTTALNAVAAITANDVWAVGKAGFADFSHHSLIEHFDGSAWSLVAGPAASGSVFNGISARASGDVWAVGSNGAGGTLATHFNGSAWTTSPTPNANVINTLNAVAVSGTNEAWAVGSAIKSTTDGVSQYRTLIEHFNGTSWTIVPSPNVGAASNELTGVAVLGPNNVVAVGRRIDTSGQIPVNKTLWMRWNGSAWSVIQSPNVGSGDNLLAGAIPVGTNDVWAWGSSANGTLVEHFTG